MNQIKKLLVANRGEIAVRVMRAAREDGIETVAVYAAQDVNAGFVQVADEAYSLNGNSSAETYLAPEKILSIAKRSGANAIHPGYGFLSENADFAEAVIAAGLIWIGPPPEAIRLLGDKVSARNLALKVKAPLAPGTSSPVSTSEQIIEFAKAHGLPVAIKAAYGGGGRGLKVAHTIDGIPDAFEAATREAIAAFGRGECFVEKYLEKPRHVETQCLADSKGKVVVISTRDCTLQRRHQKLVEEAPAPFLTQKQNKILYESSKAILKEAGYRGAGTCEFLIGNDGTISFLEVNTRIQVEHPVSEEITGIDLVHEQFRIAQGGTLDYNDPLHHGHSIEFRINGEDPGRGFLPTPGRIESLRFPGGPGVRVDSGINTGDVITGAFDSLLAKVIVTGRTRQDAIKKARRVLSEIEVTGLPTVIPFHKAVLEDPRFIADSNAGFGVHTNWIETEFDADIERWEGSVQRDFDESELFRTIIVEVEGRRLKVGVPAGIFVAGERAALSRAPQRALRNGPEPGPGEGRIKSPMQAAVIQVMVKEGQEVVEGERICVLEAMKMEQTIHSPVSGRVLQVRIVAGATVSAGDLLVEIVDSATPPSHND